MKKFYMTMVAMLCGVAAMAQNSLTVPEKIEVQQGGDAEITIGATTEGYIAALAFRIGLPAGCTLKSHYELIFDEEKEEEVETLVFDNTISEARGQGHTATIQATSEEGFMQVAVTSMPVKVLKGKEGDVVTLYFQCPDDAETGDYTIIIKEVAGSTTKGVSVPFGDVTVPLTVTPGTGINSINADDVNAPIYNVAGQRVSKAQKGVFIQNGKKIAVK